MSPDLTETAPVCYRHTDRETYVRCNRCDRSICPDCMKAASVGFQCPSCVKEGAATMRAPRAEYGGRAVSAPTVTFTIIGLNVAVFLLTTLTGTGLAFGGSPSALFEKLALTPTVHGVLQDGRVVAADGVAQGQYWRLLSSMFLHFGVIHIALNMYVLYLLGPTLETALGRLRFSALYLLSGLSGAAVSYAFGPSNVQAAGASGAVYGLFAAFFVIQRRRGGDVSSIGVIIAINLAISFAASSFIDWRGHVGGLVGGGLVALALVYAPAGRSRATYQALAGLGVLGLVVALVALRTVALTGVAA